MTTTRLNRFSPERLAALHPRLYHMAEAGMWDSIRTLGLLSTSALLDRFEVTGKMREEIESQRRPSSVEISHPKYGRAIIRDNIPMSETALLKCLHDYSPREWYELLNCRVFFWPTRQRLMKLLGARAYRDKRQLVITVDTTAVLSRHADRVTLSPINSGSTIMKPQPRGRETFQQVTDYPFEELRRKRGPTNAIAEVAVNYSIPDLADLALQAEHVEAGRTVEVLWKANDYKD